MTVAPGPYRVDMTVRGPDRQVLSVNATDITVS
jgi:hypothetical protein